MEKDSGKKFGLLEVNILWTKFLIRTLKLTKMIISAEENSEIRVPYVVKSESKCVLYKLSMGDR